MHSRATDRRSAFKCQGKWPDQTRDQAFGLPEVLVAISTSRLSCKKAGKTRTLMPVWDSSGESRMTPIPTCLSLLLVLSCFGTVLAQAQDPRDLRSGTLFHRGPFPTPFKHVVVIFQENRTPDNLFQGLCHPPFGHRHS